MSEIKEPPLKNSTNPVQSLPMRELPGWMVLGVVGAVDVVGNARQASALQSLAVPVLATSASAAMALAAASHADFQPVGVLSEDDLLDHLKAIEHHRNTFSSEA